MRIVLAKLVGIGAVLGLFVAFVTHPLETLKYTLLIGKGTYKLFKAVIRMRKEKVLQELKKRGLKKY